MFLPVDFSKVVELKPMPSSVQKVRIDKVEPKSGDKGPYFKIEYVVEEGEHTGRHLFHNISFSEKSLWKAKQWVECIGIDWEKKKGVDTMDMLGCKLYVTVELDMYDGKETNKVTGFAPIKK